MGLLKVLAVVRPFEGLLMVQEVLSFQAALVRVILGSGLILKVLEEVGHAGC